MVGWSHAAAASDHRNAQRTVGFLPPDRTTWLQIGLPLELTDYRVVEEPLGISRMVMAERGRFELPKLLRACRFSRPVHSTALPPLRRRGSARHAHSIRLQRRLPAAGFCGCARKRSRCHHSLSTVLVEAMNSSRPPGAGVPGRRYLPCLCCHSLSRRRCRKEGTSWKSC